MTLWQPTDTEIALLTHTILFYGPTSQMLKAAEEYAEASAALVRLASLGTDTFGVLERAAEELADAEIMSAQLRIIYPEIEPLISDIRARKLAALAARTKFPELLKERG